MTKYKYITLRERPELKLAAGEWFHNKWGVSPIYLVSDHIGFYEKYGWEFLCMVQGDDEPDMTRMYIHR